MWLEYLLLIAYTHILNHGYFWVLQSWNEVICKVIHPRNLPEYKWHWALKACSQSSETNDETRKWPMEVWMIWSRSFFRSSQDPWSNLCLCVWFHQLNTGTISTSPCKSKGKVLWEWRKLEGNLKKLFTVLQVNLQANGYSLKQSAFNRVSHQLNTRTRNFLKQMETERNGKRRARKKAETWIKISLYAHEILKTPYDIVAEMKATEDELRKANDQLQTTVERQAASLCEQLVEEWTNGNKGRYLCDPDHWQQRRHLSKIQ